MNLATLGYSAGWRLIRLLPESWARGLFRVGADYAANRGGGSVDAAAHQPAPGRAAGR